MDWSKVKTAYFIGIKGVGMTMLAEFLSAQGITVSGSDVPETFRTDQVLAKAGIKVWSGFEAERLNTHYDLIVYSTAYNQNNPEVAAALAGSDLVLTYAQALAKVFNYRHGIAVCGSHGKTTTSAWLAYVLQALELKPSAMIGSQVPQFGGASLVGQSDLLVIEADEYQNKLAQFEPKAALLNNIDYDHPDFFPDEQVYIKAFADFVAKLPAKGWLVANFDDAQVRQVAETCPAKVVSYGLVCAAAEFQATELAVRQGWQYFRVSWQGSDLGFFKTPLIGKHNVANALAVIAAAWQFEPELDRLREAVSGFQGTTRRLEKRGEYRGAVLIDDYAHHPTEIRATIEALRELYPDKQLRFVFHPHTFTRTKALLSDFADSLLTVDELVLLEIYGSAREEQGGVSSQELVDLISERKPDLPVKLLPDLAAAEAYVRQSAAAGQVIALVGASDIFRVADRLLAE